LQLAAANGPDRKSCISTKTCRNSVTKPLVIHNNNE
jgi:hypothetical protein